MESTVGVPCVDTTHIVHNLEHPNRDHPPLLVRHPNSQILGTVGRDVMLLRNAPRVGHARDDVDVAVPDDSATVSDRISGQD
jgi:hypothetical protein